VIRPLLNATLLDRESALYIAKKMFETYDVNNNGKIEENEARSMIIDSYTNVG
jgi:Ca2+-binding EF-hand superfamily protein